MIASRLRKRARKGRAFRCPIANPVAFHGPQLHHSWRSVTLILGRDKFGLRNLSKGSLRDLSTAAVHLAPINAAGSGGWAIHAWLPRTNKKKPRPLPRGFRLPPRLLLDPAQHRGGRQHALTVFRPNPQSRIVSVFQQSGVLVHGRN
jgi:hypothetical protein